MKYYSEELKKFFDTEKDAIEAEKVHKQEVEKKQNEEKEKSALISKEKKELAKAIEDANVQVTNAYTKYGLAKKEVEKLSREYLAKTEEILRSAKEEIKEAEDKKFAAISAFNKKFGVYSVNYTGDKARQEYLKAASYFNDLFENPFKLF